MLPNYNAVATYIQVLLINVYSNTVSILRVWLGPYPLWFSRFFFQSIAAMSLHNILLILEYSLAKFAYVCVVDSVGQIDDDLVGQFLPLFNAMLVRKRDTNFKLK